MRDIKTYNREYYVKNCETRKADNRVRYLRYKKERPNYCTIESLRKRYGLSVHDLLTLRIKQNNRCALCGGVFDETYGLKPVVDHDHVTNTIRALLHQRCNVRLGVLEDKVFYEQAIRYLEKNNGI